MIARQANTLLHETRKCPPIVQVNSDAQRVGIDGSIRNDFIHKSGQLAHVAYRPAFTIGIVICSRSDRVSQRIEVIIFFPERI